LWLLSGWPASYGRSEQLTSVQKGTGSVDYAPVPERQVVEVAGAAAE
jgi:hypothetical protein